MKIEIEMGKRVVTKPKVLLELSFEETQAIRECLVHIGGEITKTYLTPISNKLTELGFICHQGMLAPGSGNDIEKLQSLARSLELEYSEKVDRR